jgi:uncharacterized protein YqhQ
MPRNYPRMSFYGGQALIEGVLMRGSSCLAAAMRAPDGKIVILEERLDNIYQLPIKKVPLLRGLLMLWDALVLGTRFLVKSANIQGNEEEKLEGPALYGSIVFALIFGIFLFFLMPATISQGIELLTRMNTWIGNLIEGIIRLLVLIGYIWLVGRMAEIRRVFAYHGAEHKTINAYENGKDLTPEIVSQYPLEHPRCGTSFLLTVVLLSVIIFSLVGPIPFLWRLLTRILMIPVLASLSYEYIRWASRHLNNSIIKILFKPNLLIQRLTTREPTLDMIEVAITAFNTMKKCDDEFADTPDHV